MAKPEEELYSIQEILHLAHHRNKNQHRLAKWWKFLSQLRRHIAKLITELGNEFPAKTQSLGKERKSDESRETVLQRVVFLDEHLIPRCYLAFSGVVADNQYAALGLLLLSSLARVRKLVLLLRKEREIKKRKEIKGHDELRGMNMEDIGETVERGDNLNQKDDPIKGERNDGRVTKELGTPNLPAHESLGVVRETHSKRPKKRRKKGDAFDDLFDTLI